ncbi:MAG TPA: DUF2142 domain-containing protein, partial [Dehalococcoidia bacterium]|nr:DUF2142 domain-containing protein [Dehalococcoidia bacterium]
MGDVSRSTPVAAATTPQLRTGIERAWDITRANVFLILLLGTSFFFRVFWAVVVPAFQAPDEIAHVAYVQSLAESDSLSSSKWIPEEIGVVEQLTGLVEVPFNPDGTQGFAADSLNGPQEDQLDRLPASLRTTDQVGRDNTAKQYPATYYLLASLVYRVLAGFNLLVIVFGLRVFSALLSTGTMFFNYLTLRRFFGEDRLTRASAVIIAMLPMYVYMGAAVNPDVLVWLVFSVFLYLMTRAYDDGLSPSMNLGIGATIAAGTLVKQTFLIALPMYAILLAFLWCRKLLSTRQAALSLAGVLAVLAVADGWLYLSGIIRTSPSYPGEHEQQARTISGFFEHLQSRWWDYSGIYNTMWGYFGWLDTPLSPRIFALIRTGSAIATIGLIFYLVSSAVERRVDHRALFYVVISMAYIAGWVVVNYMRITSGEQ